VQCKCNKILSEFSGKVCKKTTTFVTNIYLKMDKLKILYARLKPYLNKYIITIVVFVVFIVFIDDNNVIRRVQYEIKINALRQEIKHYELYRDQSADKLEKLHSSNAELERIAREEYLMKKPNEELFVVESSKKD